MTTLPSGVLQVVMDDPSGSANKTSDLFKAELDALLSTIEGGARPIGLIFLSAKRTFGVGGDIGQIMAYAGQGLGPSEADSERIKALFRRIERLGCPTVAMIEGTAAGGGWELALACTARFCRDDSAIKLGFPEVDFGLVPGAGGMVRLTHLLGAYCAGMLISGAAMQSPHEALSQGLLTAVAESRAALLALAEAWIVANPGAVQPWDRTGRAVPQGGVPDRPAGGAPGAAAPILALAAIAEIASRGFDEGSAVESRCFAECATSAEARALIGLGFTDHNLLRRRVASQYKDEGPASDAHRDGDAFVRRVARALADEVAAARAEGQSPAGLAAAAAIAGYADDVMTPLLAARGRLPNDADGPRRNADRDTALSARLQFAQALAALGCLADGTIMSATETNVASVRGAGFPRRTGGVLRFIENFGTEAFLTTAAALAAQHGPRFNSSIGDAETLARRLAMALEYDKGQGRQL